MSLSFLRRIDRWLGSFFLFIAVLPARLISFLLTQSKQPYERYTFLKMKGGGSLIVAMPALLGLKRQAQNATFVLVCTKEAQIYAELTGIFDTYVIIDDQSFFALLKTGLEALATCFLNPLLIDLEPNSWLAALFTLLTCAHERIGLVRTGEKARALSYTKAISYNVAAPIYAYYDRLCELLGAQIAAAEDCRSQIKAKLPAPPLPKPGIRTLAIAAFTSDFAKERMMPGDTWVQLLRQKYGDTPLQLMIFGSARNQEAAIKLQQTFTKHLPAANTAVLAGAYSLAQSAAQLLLCDEVWAVDSGLLHIARLLGVPSHSFWGPTAPLQRLRPIKGLHEDIQYRAFLCSPCIQASAAPPCGGNNLCMITMGESSPDLNPSWIKK